MPPTLGTPRGRAATGAVCALGTLAFLAALAAADPDAAPALDAARGAPPASEEPGVLRVVTTGYETDGGWALLSLCRTEDEFTAKGGGTRFGKERPSGGRAEFVFADLPPGEYAIKVFHDTNENGELDAGFFGPAEPYGFSNDAAARFGPPSWSDARFRYDGRARTVEILMR